MFKFFKKDPIEKYKKQYQDLLSQAMQAQRNGDIRTYSQLTAEANAVLEKVNQLEAEKLSS